MRPVGLVGRGFFLAGHAAGTGTIRDGQIAQNHQSSHDHQNSLQSTADDGEANATDNQHQRSDYRRYWRTIGHRVSIAQAAPAPAVAILPM